jgi:alpha-L-rhamnosidase
MDHSRRRFAITGEYSMKRMSLTLSAFFLLTSFRPVEENSPRLVVTHLRCEYLTNPLGIDVPQPRLSWVLESVDASSRGQRQTAYQVVVAKSSGMLNADQGDAWDSGKISSDQTIQLTYAGKPLDSKTVYYWKVRVWDENDRASNWSDAAFWSVGLLEKSEWAAKWISDPSAVTTSQSEADSVRGVNSGYRSKIASSPDTQKWVGVDLGAPALVDSVRLFPAYPYEWQPEVPRTIFRCDLR